MADTQSRTYSKEDIEFLLNSFEIYLKSPDELENKDILMANNPKYKEAHLELFEEAVLQAQKDIQDFADGSLELDENALESMQNYIETFGKEYQNNRYGYTPQALKALEKIASLKKQKEVTQKLADQIEIVNETPQNNSRPNEFDFSRIRSDHNLSNEQKMAVISLQAMLEMGIINQQDCLKYSADILGQDINKSQQAFEFVDKTEEKIKDIKQFQNTVVDILLAQDLTEVLTPELTTVAYDNLLKRNPNNKKIDDVVTQMDSLQSDFKNKCGFYFLDVTNAADAYDGYMHMFEVRQKDLEQRNKHLKKEKEALNPQNNQARINEIEQQISANLALLQEYSQSEQEMDELIKTYDERWNIPSGKNPKDTAIRFNDRIKTATKILDQIKFDEQTLGEDLLTQISQFKFNDKNGKPLPQFIDPKNPSVKSDVWRKGLVVDPQSKLATVLKISGNDILMEKLGSKEKIVAESLVQELKDNVPFKLFEMYNSEEIIRGAIEDPQKFTTKKDQYLAEFEAKLNDPNTPLGISPEGYNAAIDAQVNKVEVFANRLNQKLGKNNAEFTNSVLFEQIKTIDRNAANRGRKSKDVKKGALKRSLWGIAAGGTLAYVGARLVTNAAATGGISLLGSSAVALGTAITVGGASIALQLWSRKKAAKARGEKYGWKEFKKDKMFWASIGTTTLACASAAFAMANAPELSLPAISCAIGSLGLGTGLRFVQPYRDMRLKGHNRLTAFALGAVNASAVFAGAYLGRQHGLDDVTPNTYDKIIGYRKIKVGEVKTYSDELISKVTTRNNTNSMWEYRGEGPHDIPAYRNPDNYSNEAWWTQEEHDKAIAALKEQMPKLGWKEGVGNEEVMLRKLASFERLHRDDSVVIPDSGGKTVGEKFGDYHALLDESLDGNLTQEGAKQLDAIQYNAGENGHSKILDRLGAALYSYKDHPHGIKTEDICVKKPIIVHVEEEVKAPAGGVFGWVVSSWNKFKNKIRPGAKADKIGKRNIPAPAPDPNKTPVPDPDKTPVPDPNKTPAPDPDKTPVPNPDKIPVPDPDKTPIPAPIKKLLLDEYKIVYGIEPDTMPGKDKAWKDYYARVEEERKVKAPEKDMNQFLLQRRADLDKVIMDHVPGDTNLTASGKSIRKDYKIKQLTDSRDKAGVVMEARQSLMQSNLSADNFANKITLSHFTKYIAHFVDENNKVADNSRDIELNPDLKKRYKKPNSDVQVVDLNQYLVEGKTLEQSTQKVKGRDLRLKMHELADAYKKTDYER